MRAVYISLDVIVSPLGLYFICDQNIVDGRQLNSSFRYFPWLLKLLDLAEEVIMT